MCGINGFINFNRALNEDDKRIVERMNDKIFHRGPDAQNSLLYKNVVFGFNRLSIIGLDNGMQPVFNEDKSVILVCNGEIFNYIELREELRSKGHYFETSTDIEVIVHLYEEHGMQFLDKLNGQFAFALYDTKKETMFCVRDHLGILPLFYTSVDNTFIFASEVKAILEHPKVKASVDPVGLDQVLTFAGLISPRTMFKGVKSLENGHYLEVTRDGKIKNVEYWDLIYPEGEVVINGRSESSYIEELEGLFENAVKLRLRADVPTGYYLSGGLDSSTIGMKISQLLPETRKEAFSIDFPDAKLSESFYQDIVAKEANSNLNKKVFHFNDIASRLQKSVYHSECPVKETYNTASLYLSGKVREENIKVILSGEGADEFFAGYVGFRFDKMREMGMLVNEVSAEEKELRKKLWGDESFYYELDFLKHNQTKRQLYSPALNSSYEEVNCLNYPIINTERIANRSTLNKRAYIDYKLRLTDHLISDHGDRMAMANSVEVRFPFLDKNIVEFSTKVPDSLKLSEDFIEKYILKKMATKFVPKAICEREKFGFVAPGSPYLLQHNKEYVSDILSYDRIKRQGFFNPDEIERLKKQYSQPGFTVNVPFEMDLLLIATTFGMFLDNFIEN
ncbi:asparagine synthase (glutamine-hydrolyzing) [Tenacibaculum sp. M341]|uniref:asparagine synthase (glutamine-hydrolyzing) n=1 Tax=Tenacibaculum sp. M341 TaxID=2530339 RepID=UPI00104DEFD3|nr:asparagine synthase (glutamine-hydrolyzing) [Tenacibaculum sp. M341]TCI85721.1 asparagine synthase (glutamine-hydrolyzing) [Tenacibaculum sp. M341]